MSPVPGYPDGKRRPIIVEPEQTPRSVPPGHVRIGGSGWRLQVPMAVLLSVASAIGARLLPTQTSTDAAVERAAIAAERRELEEQRFREEMRRANQLLVERLDRIETRVSVLEIRSAPRP